MIQLSLDAEEGIILSEEDVNWITNTKTVLLDRLVLTNKNIYLLYKKSMGLFAGSTDECNQYSLKDIKIINGQPMVGQIKKDDYGMCLQIQFVQEEAIFAFESWGRKKCSEWVNAIYKQITGTEAPVPEKASFFGDLSGIKSTIANVAGQAVGTVSNAAGSTMGTVSSMAKQAANDASMSFNAAKEHFQNEQQTNQTPVFTIPSVPQPVQTPNSFCPNCGTKIVPGTKFCPSCGTPVGSTQSSPQQSFEQVPPIPSNQMDTAINPGNRQQEYAGTVLKCPNCGAAISQTTAICPACGYHITGQAAVSSVQSFANQLMALEARRKGAGLGQLLGMSANPVDTQKLALIRSFPIPNTIDDIQEFMMLAIANIDVKLSKNTLTKKLQSKGSMSETSMTMPTTISDAWVSKMQQAYQKALVAFPDEPIFQTVKQMYIDKMTELKMKID